MMKLLSILVFWVGVAAKGQDLLHESNTVRYADLKNINIYRKAGTDSIFLSWCGGGKSFLYRDSAELRAVGGAGGLNPADTTAMLVPYLRSNVAAATYAALSHTHTIANVTGLQTALDGKAASSHNHAAGDVNSGTFADARIPQTAVTQHQSALTIAESQVTNLTTDLSGKQASDADLTAIAALSATNDDIIQRKAGAWTNRTVAQFKTDLQLNNVPNTDATNRANHTGTQAANTITGLATVATSGSYNDLSNKPAVPSITILGADVTNNNGTANTIADVTGLSFAVTSGSTYKFRFVIVYTAAATTTGSRWSINGPSTSFLHYRSSYSLTTTSRTFNEGLSSYNVPSASNLSSAATGSNMVVIEGLITPSANGTVIARFASEVASSAIVAKAKSYVEYQQIQ